MKKGLLVFCLFAGFCIQSLVGQTVSGEKVGIYFSKKGFQLEDYYLKDLDHFVKTAGFDHPDLEDLKLECLITMGSLLPEQLKPLLTADSVFFINEHPELARAFLQGYDSNMDVLQGLDSLFDDTDKIMVFSKIQLGANKRSAVFVRSNRILTEQVWTRTSRMGISVFSPSSGAKISSLESCFNEDNWDEGFSPINLHKEESKLGRMLSSVFSKAILQYLKGEEGDCL